MHVVGSHFLALNANKQTSVPFAKTKCVAVFNQREAAMHFLCIVGRKSIGSNGNQTACFVCTRVLLLSYFATSYDAVGMRMNIYFTRVRGPRPRMH